MKHRRYCCDASRDLYEQYYSRQNGGEIPVYAGRRFQRGHGLGSILGGFVRRLVLPFFQTNAKSMLKNAAKTGVEVVGDVVDGRSFVDSVKKRVPTGIKRGVEDIVFQSAPVKKQRGTTTAKTTTTTTTTRKRRPRQRRQRRRYRDIFA